MPAETGTGDWSGDHGVWLLLFILGSGHLWWNPAKQWCR